jgi:hypothetical protein
LPSIRQRRFAHHTEMRRLTDRLDGMVNIAQRRARLAYAPV